MSSSDKTKLDKYPTNVGSEGQVLKTINSNGKMVLSWAKDEDTKIVANKITKFGSKSSRILKIDITDISEEQKEKLRGAIKFFAGDRNNIAVKIINGDTSVMSGGIFINEQIYNEFKEIAGSDRVSIEE